MPSARMKACALAMRASCSASPMGTAPPVISDRVASASSKVVPPMPLLVVLLMPCSMMVCVIEKCLQLRGARVAGLHRQRRAALKPQGDMVMGTAPVAELVGDFVVDGQQVGGLPEVQVVLVRDAATAGVVAPGRQVAAVERLGHGQDAAWREAVHTVDAGAADGEGMARREIGPVARIGPQHAPVVARREGQRTETGRTVVAEFQLQGGAAQLQEGAPAGMELHAPAAGQRLHPTLYFFLHPRRLRLAVDGGKAEEEAARRQVGEMTLLPRAFQAGD